MRALAGVVALTLAALTVLALVVSRRSAVKSSLDPIDYNSKPLLAQFVTRDLKGDWESTDACQPIGIRTWTGRGLVWIGGVPDVRLYRIAAISPIAGELTLRIRAESLRVGCEGTVYLALDYDNSDPKPRIHLVLIDGRRPSWARFPIQLARANERSNWRREWREVPVDENSVAEIVED